MERPRLKIPGMFWLQGAMMTAVLISLFGCSGKYVKTSDYNFLKTETLLLLPAKDLTHGGVFVDGSGREFQNYIEKAFSAKSPSTKIFLYSGKDINNQQDIDIQTALKEGKSYNVDYVLVIVLGEMRDAAPMSFRSDFVTIQDGSLYRIRDGKKIWSASPFKNEGTNLYSYNRLLEEIAGDVVKSLTGDK